MAQPFIVKPLDREMADQACSLVRIAARNLNLNVRRCFVQRHAIGALDRRDLLSIENRLGII